MKHDNHAFDVEDAKKYGVPCAVILLHIRFWVRKNQATNKHFYDGRNWTYGTAKELTAYFPYWSEKQIRTHLNKLVDVGAILKAKHKSSNYDQTLFYTLNTPSLPNGNIDVDQMGNFDLTKRANVFSNTDTKTDNNTKYPFSEFWDLYDKKRGKPKCERKYNKLAESTRKLIFEHIPKYKKAQPDKQYRKDPITYLNNESWLDELIEVKQQNGNYNNNPAPAPFKPTNQNNDLPEWVEH